MSATSFTARLALLALAVAFLGCGRPPSRRPQAQVASGPVAKPIRGTVVDPAGAPVAGAVVAVDTDFSLRRPRTVTTDERGQFEILLLPASGWNPAVGRVCVYFPGLAVGGGLLVNGGNTIRLRPSCDLSGRVLDESGLPVPHALVKVGSVGDLRKGFAVFGGVQDRLTARTDDKGHWTIHGVPADAVRVHLDDPRFIHETLYAEVGIPGEPPPTLVARPGASITGRLMYEDGRPAHGVDLFAQGQSTMAGAWARTSTDGSYRLTGLPADTYNVMVDEASGEWVAAAQEGIPITPPSSVSVPDLVLTHGAIVEGQVFDKVTGLPLPGVSVGSYGPHRPRSTAAITSARTDAGGHYRLRVATGLSYIYICGPPPGYDDPAHPASKTVNLSAGDTAKVDFTIAPQPKRGQGWWPF